MNMPVFLSVVPRGQELDGMKKFEASLCLRCGLAFNSNPLSQGMLDKIYRNYRYIRPHKGIGVSKYQGFISFIQDYVPRTAHLVEIGSADGYLLDFLSTKGYTHIEGFEPSQEFLFSKNKDKIRGDFFGEKTSFTSKVDAFILMHVLEHFPSPQDVVKNMRRNLSSQGKILFEVPNFSGFYHQHLLFFSLHFVRHMAEEMGFKLISGVEDKNVLRVVLEENENIEKIEKIPSSISCEHLEKLERYADQIQSHNERILANVKRILEESILRGTPVYWWGTGSTSIITLANINDDLLKNSQIILLDNDFDRKGFVLPLLAMQESPVCYAPDYLPKMRDEDFLVIASEFFEEIVAGIDKKHTLPRNILPINIL